MEEIKIPRLLLNEAERGADLDRYSGSKEGFSLWQQALDPFFYQRPLVERIKVAYTLAGNRNGPDVLRLSVALGPLPPLAHSTTDFRGRTLLHAVARGMGSMLCWNRSSLSEVSSHRSVKDSNGMKAQQNTQEVCNSLMSNI